MAYCSNVIAPTGLSLCTTAAPSKMTALIPYGDSRTKGTSVSKQVSSSDFAENRILPESDNDGGKVWFSCLKNSSTLLPLFWHPIYSLEKRAVSFFATLANDILINSVKKYQLIPWYAVVKWFCSLKNPLMYKCVNLFLADSFDPI